MHPFPYTDPYYRAVLFYTDNCAHANIQYSLFLWKIIPRLHDTTPNFRLSSTLIQIFFFSRPNPYMNIQWKISFLPLNTRGIGQSGLSYFQMIDICVILYLMLNFLPPLRATTFKFRAITFILRITTFILPATKLVQFFGSPKQSFCIDRLVLLPCKISRYEKCVLMSRIA